MCRYFDTVHGTDVELGSRRPYQVAAADATSVADVHRYGTASRVLCRLAQAPRMIEEALSRSLAFRKLRPLSPVGFRSTAEECGVRATAPVTPRRHHGPVIKLSSWLAQRIRALPRLSVYVLLHAQTETELKSRGSVEMNAGNGSAINFQRRKLPRRV